jgi:hypothetical protein
LALALAVISAAPASVPAAGLAGPPRPSVIPAAAWCGTVDSVDVAGGPTRGLSAGAGCPEKGPCDDPGTRDSTRVEPITIPLIAHIIRSRDGSCDYTPAGVERQIANLNDYFERNGAGFKFELEVTRIHVDDELAFLPGCDSASTCARALRAVALTRALYAESPASYCNVYFSCLATSRWGGYSGVGYYPWSSEAVGVSGGVWVNSLDVDLKPHLLPHEMGHVLGLYHVHRGVSEVTGCSDPCYEGALDPEADRRGDFASDTPATPVNYWCGDPADLDCREIPYAPTLYGNLMGYGPPECTFSFTPQQVRRMQCWARSKLASWSGAATSPPEIRLRAIPNPATSGLNLAFEMPQAGRVRVEVFDLLGRRVSLVLDEDRPAGTHRVRWSGATGAGGTARPGIYLARIRCGSRAGHVTFAWRP